MLFVVAALADRRHIRDIPRFANVATAEMIVVRRYVWSTNALVLWQGRILGLGREIVSSGKATRRRHIQRYVEERQRRQTE